MVYPLPSCVPLPPFDKLLPDTGENYRDLLKKVQEENKELTQRLFQSEKQRVALLMLVESLKASIDRYNAIRDKITIEGKSE